MSDDYAAITTTVMLAVLLIGTVQTYSLLKSWSSYFAPSEEEAASIATLLNAIKSGQPLPDTGLRAVKAPLDAPFRNAGRLNRLMAACLVWLGMCLLLVGTQIRVMLWVATHSPAKDPELAKGVFVVCVLAIVVLAVEGLARIGGRLMETYERLTARTGPLSRADTALLVAALEATIPQEGNAPLPDSGPSST